MRNETTRLRKRKRDVTSRVDSLKAALRRQPRNGWQCSSTLYASLFYLLSCSTHFIPNTYVEDTALNREILAFVDGYRRAVESRNMRAIIALTSKNYFDDMGTPIGDDDVDYDTLKKSFDRLSREILATRFQISYRGITYIENRILVDIFYTGWFQINTEQGPKWRRRLEPHRLVLAREEGGYRILSGI